jgi:hypothetical protein
MHKGIKKPLMIGLSKNGNAPTDKKFAYEDGNEDEVDEGKILMYVFVVIEVEIVQIVS